MPFYLYDPAARLVYQGGATREEAEARAVEVGGGVQLFEGIARSAKPPRQYSWPQCQTCGRYTPPWWQERQRE